MANSTKRLTQEQFLYRCKNQHGDSLDFSLAVYKNVRSAVTVKCKIHGEFQKSAKDLMNGVGCYHCRWEEYKNSKHLSTQEFIQKAKKLHSDYYDYNKTQYVNSRTPVTIICPEHGEFQQGAGGHLEGYGCKKCADQKHGDYRPWLVKTYFERFPEKANIPATLYLLYCKEYDFYKIGITRQDVETRHKYMSGYDFVVIDRVEDTFYNISIAEQNILKHQKRYIPAKKFGGYTECIVEPVDLKQYVHPKRDGIPIEEELGKQ